MVFNVYCRGAISRIRTPTRWTRRVPILQLYESHGRTTSTNRVPFSALNILCDRLVTVCGGRRRRRTSRVVVKNNGRVDFSGTSSACYLPFIQRRRRPITIIQEGLFEVVSTHNVLLSPFSISRTPILTEETERNRSKPLFFTSIRTMLHLKNQAYTYTLFSKRIITSRFFFF